MLLQQAVGEQNQIRHSIGSVSTAGFAASESSSEPIESSTGNDVSGGMAMSTLLIVVAVGGVATIGIIVFAAFMMMKRWVGLKAASEAVEHIAGMSPSSAVSMSTNGTVNES